ncbi:MAG: hypothetical protein H0Z19_10490 [Archaeoglobus sp.]|uniref:hypothetical protein n=1 Tax=Archaeoglobus sp. TaxID=1872626 RepID=UPI001D37EC88|nr:hypothetical protein [Archaeoglobus sp.]MBO8180881.1 hypothetical protein [Archaeoglobus sp.]
MKTKMVRLGTYISQDTYKLLRDLTDIYGNQSNVLEQAIKLLYDISKYGSKVDRILVREKLINEFENVLISKRNFMHLLQGKKDSLYDEDVITAIVLSFVDENRDSKNFFPKVMESLRKIYVEGNRWFTNIELKTVEGEFKVTFYHNLDREFSDFASEYFKRFFSKMDYKIVEEQKLNKLFILKISDF